MENCSDLPKAIDCTRYESASYLVTLIITRMNTWIVINNSYPGNKLRQGFQVSDYRYPVCFELMFYSSITLREAHLSPTLEWHTESVSPVTFTYLLSPFSTPRLAWLFFFVFCFCSINSK